MAKRPVLDASELDRAAAIAEGRTPENPEPREEGEAELTAPARTEAEPAAEPPAAEPELAAPEAEPAAKTVHSARSEIVARAKAKRLEDASEASEPALAPEPAPEPEPVARVEVPKRKVKVDRVEREVGEEEYDTAARVGLALGNRLTEFNHLLPQLRQLASQLASQPQRGDTPTDRDSPASPPVKGDPARRTPSRVASITDEKLDQIGEQLAYGEPEDRRAALRALAEEIGGPSVTVDDVVTEIEARNARSNEVASAGVKFAERHPTVAHDPGLRDLTARQMHQTAVAEMRAIGVEENYLREAAADIEVALAYHQNLLGQGFELSGPEMLADNAAKVIASRYRVIDPAAPAASRPNPTPTNLTPSTQRQITPAANRADREIEKEQMRQPRRAAMVARTPPAPMARSKTDVIQGMRQKRGYTTVA